MVESQCLVYTGPDIKDRIRIPKAWKDLNAFEKSLQEKLDDDKFMLDPWATHVFAIEESIEPVKTKELQVQIIDHESKVLVLENWGKSDI